MIKSFFLGNKEIRLPVIQGGMGVGVSLSGLASAVANEGGIGVISSAGLGLLYRQTPADYLKDSTWGLKEELRKVRELTKGVVGVNIMVALSKHVTIQKVHIVLFWRCTMPQKEIWTGYAFAGANAYLTEKISSVKEVIQKLKGEFTISQNRLLREGS